MSRLLIRAALTLMMTLPVWAQLDLAPLAAEYRAAEAASKGGWGESASADSGTLGWGEGALLQDYAAMWEATADPYWLEKIARHFDRIMANASDPDGDGFLSWQTKSYSSAVAFAERLSNVSDAKIAPEQQKNTNGAAAAKCEGHTYLIEFQTGPAHFRIRDRDSGRLLADNVAYQSGAKITQIEPFRFSISGQAHQGDRFLIRTIAPEPLEYAVHQGMFVYPVAVFIEAVKTRPALQSKFGADADRFLAFVLRHVFEKNEEDWLDLGESGGYRFMPRITDRMPNRIMPHNQYATLARAWLVLKDVPGVPPLVGRRAAQMVRFFHDHLELDAARDAYRWYYSDWIEYGQAQRSRFEDTSHACLNVCLAIEASRRGVIFNDAELRRIANTWLKVMWNQDSANPLMAAAVDGRKPHTFSALTSGWTQLSQWDPRVYELAGKAFQAEEKKKRWQQIPELLLSAKRAGVLAPEPGPVR